MLRRPGYLLGLVAAIVGFGVFSSSIGSGALPDTSVPPFGLTNGTGSLSTVAQLGDVNGDNIGDYAIGLPSANADAGVVYVFLGHAGALPPTPTALNPALGLVHDHRSRRRDARFLDHGRGHEQRRPRTTS